MTKSLYIIGGAGAGKSTFMANVLMKIDAELGPLQDLHSKRNAKALVTLRGHAFREGVYLGKMRQEFPGTDGLDRASSTTAVDWLESGRLPRRIVGEGATLATAPFLSSLSSYTELLVAHLVAPLETRRERGHERGSDQAETFLVGTATRSANLATKLRDTGVVVLDVDTTDEIDWEFKVDLAAWHVL